MFWDIQISKFVQSWTSWCQQMQYYKICIKDRNIIYIMKIWSCRILHIDIITKEIFLSKDKKNAAVPCPFIFKGDLHDKIAKLQWLTSIDSPLNLVKSPAAKICWHVSKLWQQNKSFDCKKIHCFCSLAKFIWLIPLFD